MYTLHLRIMSSYNAQDIRRRRFPHEEYHRYTFSPTDDFEHKAARCVSVLMIGYTLTNALQSKLLQFSVNHGIMNHQNSRILRILMPKGIPHLSSLQHTLLNAHMHHAALGRSDP